MQTITDALLALFLALGSVWFAVDLVRKSRCGATTAELGPQPAPVAALAAADPVPLPGEVAAAADASIPAGHLVVIAAAVHQLFQGRARLVSAIAVSALPAAAPAAHAPIDWAREGRRDIFTSHRVR